ncbi:MAG: hypothetical protein QOJ12_1631 [Thermoleophilales bacterium]|jgi:hypothetical protein|nr:hypothetical protein [Thermoleophilales bacterium]
MLDHVTRTSIRRLGAGRPLALVALAALALTLSLMLASSALAGSAVPLGTADSFAVLAGSTITNTGSTSISGDIGLCCTGLATPGFGPGANQVNQPSGAIYTGPGTLAATAQNDLDIAYGDAAGRAVTRTVPVDLSLTGTPASPLLPGVYESTAHGAFQINTSLTLDFQGDPNAVFIFQGTSLTTAVGAAGSVNIVNGGATPSTCNVYWQLADATQGLTLGAGSAFKGTAMALGASVLGTGATVEGRILTRRSKAVTLDTNTITRTSCFATAPSGGGAAPTTTTVGFTPPSAATPTSPPRPGSARLSGPDGPVTGPFTVTVTGREIRRVTFYVDGRRRATIRSRPGRTRFKLSINPRGQSGRAHRVTAHVTYTQRSRTPTTTLRLTYRRIVTAPHVPRFTG